jgi:hypothetical protein
MTTNHTLAERGERVEELAFELVPGKAAQAVINVLREARAATCKESLQVRIEGWGGTR